MDSTKKRSASSSPSQNREKRKKRRKKRKVSVVDPIPPVRRPLTHVSNASQGPSRQRSRPIISSLPSQPPPPPVVVQDPKDILLEKHQAALNNIQQGLTCQVCLDLLHLPYALAPCGHVTCHGCLVQWFQSSTTQAPSRKTCPHCRVVVRERPVEVWAIKSMVANLLKSDLLPDYTPLSPPVASANLDPWHGIFPKPLAHYPGGQPGVFADFPIEDIGIQDVEDGGIYRCLECLNEIWNGHCTGCDREYRGHPQLSLSEDDVDVGDLLALRMPGIMYADFTDSELDDEDEDEDDIMADFIDDEDSSDTGDLPLIPLPLHMRTASPSSMRDSSRSVSPVSTVVTRPLGSRSRIVDVDEDEQSESDGFTAVRSGRRSRAVLELTEDEDEETDEE